MRSILGLLAMLIVAAGCAFVWWLAERPGATWLDAKWLFLAALPYNWTMLKFFGESNFTPESWGEVGAAFAVDAALAYVAGALLEAVARGGVRLARFIGRA